MEQTKKGFFKSLIGTKAFYAAVIAMIIPMIIQQGITNFVNLLDNVMIGQLGTEEMSSVAIVNQVIFVFNLAVFGAVSGASIFGAQFYGKGDNKGFQDTLRLKIWISIVISVVGIAIFMIFGEQLISLFLNEAEGETSDLAYTLESGMVYLRISLIGLIPFALVQCLSSTLKDAGETFDPMVASVIAILVNLVLNFVLIYGVLGFPALGVKGAAIATVIARYIELAYMIFALYRKRKKYTFMNGAFSTMKVPMALVKRVLWTATPLILNETLWALGQATISQSYSVRGLSAVAATNISGTVWNVFAIIMFSMGHAVGILAGQQLGANRIEEAKDTVRKLLFMTVVMNVVVGLLIIAAAPFIPYIYNTTEYVRQTATTLLIISGIILPFDAYTNVTYFTMRSGGKTFITFLFDCVFQWVVVVPVVFLMANFTDWSIPVIFILTNATILIKIVIGTIMIKSGVWAKNVVNDVSSKPSKA